MDRIAWAITGAGHFLSECLELALRRQDVDLFLSRAAEEVVRMYRLKEQIGGHDLRVYRETLASSPLSGRFSGGVYRLLVVAPATSNSVAKFVWGISDSLVANLFAQAGKSRVPIVVLPTDISAEMDSATPRGKLIKVYPRPIDLENVERLRGFPGVTVVTGMEELERCLTTCS
jgi:dihydromethanopterin reductase (acceptor)